MERCLLWENQKNEPQHGELAHGAAI